MEDREILELAAKAAGLEVLGVIVLEDGTLKGVDVADGTNITHYWHPLADDGDAFRLACDLGLRVFPIARTASGAACSAVGSATGTRLSEVADMALSVRAASRKAITLAAAEIGRLM